MLSGLVHTIFADSRFASGGGNSEDESDGDHDGQSIPRGLFSKLLTAVSSNPHAKVSGAVADRIEALIEALFDPSKRWFAYRLLEMARREGLRLAGAETSTEAAQDSNSGRDGTTRAHAATVSRLKAWQEDLSQEEAEELEEDIETVARIVPHRVMTELESWIEDARVQETLDNDEDVVVMARFSVWLFFLRRCAAGRHGGPDDARKLQLVRAAQRCVAVHSERVSPPPPVRG